MTQPSMEQSPIVFQILLQMFSGIINRMQKDQIDYLISENQILHDHLKKELNSRRLLLTINEKRTLATLGKIIGRKKLKEIGTLFSPDTILRWYREIVGRKYDSSRSHMDVIAATDFFTVPVVTWTGIATYYVLFVIELETRKVCFAGMTQNPNEEFMSQCALQLTDDFGGFLSGKRYLIHDRDTKYTEKFRGILKTSGVKPLKLPARSPDLNAFSERFVLSAKSECFNKLIVLGEQGLRHTANQYLEHYEKERNHQGLDNAIVNPAEHVGRPDGKIVCHHRLGGLLKYYARAA